MMKWLEPWANPPRQYSPIPFWFLNGDLDHEEIRAQLRDFCDHGVYGVVLHPRMGLSDQIGYLSDAFFAYLRTAIETAAELDMRVVLYDEGMYPSGSAGGQVVQGHPEWASRGIALVPCPQSGDTVLAPTREGYLVERFSDGTIRGVHFGEDDGEPSAPPSADILNPEAVARFIHLTHDAYWREFAPWFGKTIVGFFTDEPSILGRNTRGLFPWTMGFAELFLRAGGHLEGLTALFSGEENEDTRLYHRLILQREGDVYYAALSRWCEKHGIWLMGHPHQSDDIEVQRYFHVPGQDLVLRWVAPEKGGTAGIDSVMGKCSADMARLLGRKRNSNECFGACNRDNNPWYFTGADMKWYIDWLAVRGVNLFIPHAFYYSLAGARCMERPPDVGPGSIWWPYYRRWAAYMARLSWLMTEGQAEAHTAVLCRNRDLRPDTVAPLFERQISFQYVPESVWSQCREENGKLLLKDWEFRAVLGEENQFPSVPHDLRAVTPDVMCSSPQPFLRCCALRLWGQRAWLLVNEGEQEIRTELKLPVQALIGTADVWTGRAERVKAERTTDGTILPLRLLRRESMLLFACENDEEWRALPAAGKAPWLRGVRFSLEGHDEQRHQKVYTAAVELKKGGQDRSLRVQGEDMAELYVNGAFCGAAFWSPQEFVIPGEMLREGENDLRLVVTGCPANTYGRPVEYGLQGGTGK